ncbi:hypothetical protein K7432_014961 [Basidiobolus ranarum]|uniref:Uncharacterized protein n=1 Tax=Basidiobolus ranarum TaxID=34480 RepID=A0ABR2WGR4_9FUNG
MLMLQFFLVSNIMENMVKFDNKNGICTFTIDDKSNWLESTPLATRVLSKMIHTIGSKDHSPRLEQVLSLREEITEFRRSARRKSVALGGTLITSPKSGSSDWTVSRQPPKRNELWKLNKELRWDAPNLWDDRIFVALQGSPSTKLFIRPLNNTDREQVQDIDDFHRRMRQWFSKVPESSRFTIPSVVDSQDNLVAIPTLDINLDPKLVQFTVIHRNSRDFS